MGIKNANSELLIVSRRVYGHCCSACRVPWQVSGQLEPEAKQSSLSSSLVFYRIQNNSGVSFPGLSSSKQTTWLKGTMVCAARISPASEWPICVPKKSGRRIGWRPSCNAQVWTSAACRWHALSMGFSKSMIQSLRGFKRSFAFPSSCFFHRRFRI